MEKAVAMPMRGFLGKNLFDKEGLDFDSLILLVQAVQVVKRCGIESHSKVNVAFLAQAAVPCFVVCMADPRFNPAETIAIAPHPRIGGDAYAR